MRIRIITIVTTFILAGLVLQIKNQYFIEPSNIAMYYFTAFFITSIMLIVVTTISLLNLILKHKKAEHKADDKESKPNLRECYRIIYESNKNPHLIIRYHADSNAEYVFKILDISETGIKFLNDNNLKLEDKIEGELSFPDGETFQVDGNIIRKQDDQVILNLNSPIPYSKIIREQRDIIRERKSETT